jgi:hypothetical protein
VMAKDGLENHLAHDHVVETKTWKCEKCEPIRKFKIKNKYTRHRRAKHVPKNKKEPCPYNTNRKHVLRNHLMSGKHNLT